MPFSLAYNQMTNKRVSRNQRLSADPRFSLLHEFTKNTLPEFLPWEDRHTQASTKPNRPYHSYQPREFQIILNPLLPCQGISTKYANAEHVGEMSLELDSGAQACLQCFKNSSTSSMVGHSSRLSFRKSAFANLNISYAVESIKLLSDSSLGQLDAQKNVTFFPFIMSVCSARL